MNSDISRVSSELTFVRVTPENPLDDMQSTLIPTLPSSHTPRPMSDVAEVFTPNSETARAISTH